MLEIHMMADTLPNITLDRDTWTNLYTASGLSVGTHLVIQNVGQTRILLHTGATAPSDTDGFNVLPVNADPFINQVSSSGEWAQSVDADGTVNVGEAE